MITVLFFGRVREQLDSDKLEIPWSDAYANLNALQAHLCKERGGSWDAVLGQDNMIRAINQTVVSDNPALVDGDEVAFFPPVTGG